MPSSSRARHARSCRCSGPSSSVRPAPAMSRRTAGQARIWSTVASGARDLERRDRDDGLRPGAELLAGRGDDPDVRGGVEQAGRGQQHRVDHPLAVVEHDQHRAGRREAADLIEDDRGAVAAASSGSRRSSTRATSPATSTPSPRPSRSTNHAPSGNRARACSATSSARRSSAAARAGERREPGGRPPSRHELVDQPGPAEERVVVPSPRSSIPSRGSWSRMARSSGRRSGRGPAPARRGSRRRISSSSASASRSAARAVQREGEEVAQAFVVRLVVDQGAGRVDRLVVAPSRAERVHRSRRAPRPGRSRRPARRRSSPLWRRRPTGRHGTPPAPGRGGRARPRDDRGGARPRSSWPARTSRSTGRRRRPRGGIRGPSRTTVDQSPGRCRFEGLAEASDQHLERRPARARRAVAPDAFDQDVVADDAGSVDHERRHEMDELRAEPDLGPSTSTRTDPSTETRRSGAPSSPCTSRPAPPPYGTGRLLVSCWWRLAPCPRTGRVGGRRWRCALEQYVT